MLGKLRLRVGLKDFESHKPLVLFFFCGGYDAVLRYTVPLKGCLEILWAS